MISFLAVRVRFGFGGCPLNTLFIVIPTTRISTHLYTPVFSSEWLWRRISWIGDCEWINETPLISCHPSFFTHRQFVYSSIHILMSVILQCRYEVSNLRSYPLLQGEINEELLLIDYCHVEIHTHPTAFPQCTTQRVFKLLHIREH